MILDTWIEEKYGRADRASLDAALPGLLARAVENAKAASFYRDYPVPCSLEEFARLPLMAAEDLRAGALLCVPQDRVARIVTLFTSGTAGEPKRLFFSEADLEHTVDYFAHGMRLVAKAGERCLLLLPCRSPDGVGDLLARGLARMDVAPVRHGGQGPLALAPDAQSVVGSPAQALALCAYRKAHGLPLPARALVSGDYVPRALLARLRAMGVEPFEHYGLSESGYGCAIDCAAHDGMHLRENDLYLEVLGPAGRPAYGVWGEILLTTLNRDAMPLIRYRTGDRGMLRRERCACGSALTRIIVRGRDAALAALDEALYPVENLGGYTAAWENGRPALTLYAAGPLGPLPDLDAKLCIEPLRAFPPAAKRQLMNRQ